jgi:4-diphosphocytidyl-2-C-methyl-D-erythritol kinase
MFVYRSASGVLALAPAKLNLTFEVLAKRDDGYHEIETLMVPIGLYDVLTFEPRPSDRLRLNCRWAGAPDRSAPVAHRAGLPPESQNLAFRAAEALRARAGVRLGAELTLVKRIPMAAGLGGGSSDAAAALVAGNLAWNLGLSPAELSALAAGLGSDVPFFLGRGAAVCRGRGEQVTPVAGLRGLPVVVVHPPHGLSTAAVYARCRPASCPRAWEPLAGALRRGDWAQADRGAHNALEPAAESLWPGIQELKAELVASGCRVVQMTGSGSSVFGICRGRRQALSAASRMRSRNLGQVFAVCT